MSPFPYDQLWHYSEKFTWDPDLRQDLVLMAYQQDLRFGHRSEIRLLKNFMKYRSKEIHIRNSLGKSIGGKSKMDVWSHEHVSMSKPLKNGFCLGDTVTSAEWNPFSLCVVHDFADALPELEGRVAELMIAGYTQREMLRNLGITMDAFREARNAVKEKALEYLM